MGISSIDFYNYVSENTPTRDLKKAYTTLGFGDEPLTLVEKRLWLVPTGTSGIKTKK